MDPNQQPQTPPPSPAQPPYSPVPPQGPQMPPQPQYQQPTGSQQPQQYQGQQPPQPYLQPLQYNPYRPSPPQPTLKPISMAAPKKVKTIHGPRALLFNEWMKKHWKALLLSLLGVFILGVVVYQVVYPNDRILPGVRVNGIDIGGMRKSQAAQKLDDAYAANVKLNIYFGQASAAFLSPVLKDVGISIVNENRINSISYPFYLRIIPGSFLFASSFSKPGPLEYAYSTDKIQEYTQSKVGDTCTIPARNATLKLVDSKLQVVSSAPGGTCDIAQFQQILSETKPQIGSENQVHIPSTDSPAPVDDDKARELADKLNDRLKDPMPISVAGTVTQIPGRIVLGWLDFKPSVPETSIDNSANATAKLLYTINNDRFSAYMNADISAKVTIKPGVTKISTLDFTETSHVDGKGGRVIDIPAAIVSVTNYIERKIDTAVAVTKDVGPTVVYTRKYNPTSTGYQAMFAQFAQDNPGTYSIALREFGSVRVLRNGAYNADARMPSAGIEGIYIGYDVLVNRKNGNLLPGTIISKNRDVATCFQQMFTYSDDDCRLGFYRQFGFNMTTAMGAQIGLQNTVFAERDGVTSANDLLNTILNIRLSKIGGDVGATQMLGYMQNTRESEGIPAGITTTKSIQHIIGTSGDTIRNDAAIISSPKSTYVLVVLSKDSNWETIAKLAKQIEAFQQVPEPRDMK